MAFILPSFSWSLKASIFYYLYFNRGACITGLLKAAWLSTASHSIEAVCCRFNHTITLPPPSHPRGVWSNEKGTWLPYRRSWNCFFGIAILQLTQGTFWDAWKPVVESNDHGIAADGQCRAVSDLYCIPYGSALTIGNGKIFLIGSQRLSTSTDYSLGGAFENLTH